jgi:hypothetical protein
MTDAQEKTTGLSLAIFLPADAATAHALRRV